MYELVALCLFLKNGIDMLSAKPFAYKYFSENVDNAGITPVYGAGACGDLSKISDSAIEWYISYPSFAV